MTSGTLSLSSPDESVAGLVATTTRQDFSAHHLLRLLKGEVYAVRVRDLLVGETFAGLRDRLVGRADHGPLGTDPQFRRLGRAFSETTTEDARDSYFNSAAELLENLREISNPYSYPADTLRLLLDEVWPSGATVLTFQSRKFFAGVVRYQQPGVDLEPHTDNVTRNLPPGETLGITRQLSVNVYLDVPDVGGELEFWDQYPSEDDYQQLSGDRTWGVDRAAVGAPALTIKPEAGEAIFIDPRRVHAVRPSADRPRVTVGLFVGARANGPLAVWS